MIIDGYENYTISRNGLVYSIKSKKFLNQEVSNSGYKRVFLYKDGVYKKVAVHRLVAKTFIPNPDNKPLVCHKDDNKLNNSVDNLLWGTHKDNMVDMSGKSRTINQYGKQCEVLDLNTGEIFNSLNHVKRSLGISLTSVYRILLGISKKYKHIKLERIS